MKLIVEQTKFNVLSQDFEFVDQTDLVTKIFQ